MAVAVVAATAALWVTRNVRGLFAALGSALIAGAVVVAMLYTATAAVTVRLDRRVPQGCLAASEFILPPAVGVAVFLTAGAIIVTMSPPEATRPSRPEPELIAQG